MENQTVNILMVDDRNENLLALEAVLASSNYRLIKANSGEEALKWVLKMDFAVILLDVQMPGMNGFETAKLIRAREKSKSIPIIFITALSQTQEHMMHGYSVGAIDYVFKPFPPLVLKSKVEGFVKIYLSQLKIQKQNQLILEHTRELEKAHARLKQSEALARTITEVSLDTLITVNRLGEITSINPAGTKMFGYQEEELIYQPLSIILPIFKEESLEGVEKAKILESVGERKNQSKFPVDFQICPAMIAEDPIFVCSIRDITEQKLQFDRLENLVAKRTEELLESHRSLENEIEEKQQMVQIIKEREQKYKSLFENHPDSVYSVDLEGRFTSLNEAALRLTGRSREELIGSNFLDLIDERELEACIASIQSALKGNPYNKETKIIHKDGGIIDINSTVIPIIIDNQIIGLYGIAKDISLEKNLWRKLYESEEKYRQLVEGSPDAIIIQQIGNEEWEYINKTGLKLLGIEEDHQLSSNKINHWIHQDDLHIYRKAIEVGADGRHISTYEARLMRIDGEMINVQMHCIPTVYFGLPSLYLVIRDITELEQSREFIKQSDKLTVVGELAAGIAHEIRNPLTSLRGFTQLLQLTANSEHEYVPIMIEEIDRINTIVSELLLLSKPNTVDFAEVNIWRLLETIVTLMKAEANLHGVEINIESDVQHTHYTYGIENKIKQVFVNILKNAIEAMPDGGEATIYMKSEGELISITFTDQGKGIPADILEKIGQPFFTTKEKGTGLGMMVCQSIIESHNGTMRIESEVGKGTSVEISLPLCKSEEIVSNLI